ncbi:hypothetical protein RV08_GL000712 [Enterococcus mundtii]|nr:hypothetical protein RV08_GL000712 [Enterococcus mundtii]
MICTTGKEKQHRTDNEQTGSYSFHFTPPKYKKAKEKPDSLALFSSII